MTFLKRYAWLFGVISIIVVYNLIRNSFDTPTSSSTLPPAPTETSKIISSPSPVPRALLKHLSEKLFMQDLINQERKKAGVPLVGLGDNVAAQLHAESSLANCFSSHWGLNGLKPYMRYSLAGGYQSNAENGAGNDYCIAETDGYAPIRSVQQKLTEMMDGLMSSPGHRRNILDKSHKKVNIGLAWTSITFSCTSILRVTMWSTTSCP